MQRIISPAKRVSGTVEIPGDKSISHRALMISAIAEGKSILENISQGMDVQCTAACLREMGVDIQRENNKTFVAGKGLTGLKKPKRVLNVGNSGTTIRLLSGILA